MVESKISHVRLLELLHYEPVTGIWTWKKRRSGTAIKGSQAGTVHHSGYIIIEVDRRQYSAHQLAWFYSYGEWTERVDHDNTIKTDNSLANLRIATRSENRANSKQQRDLPKGVYPRGGKFQSSIRVQGKNKHLGTFSSIEAAHDAYMRAATENFGKFARAS